jgi:hypothetical protein
MVDNGRDEAWRAYLRKYGMAAVQPQLLPDGSRYPPPFEWHGPPRSYVVRYEGLGRDEAEFDFELDAPRHLRIPRKPISQSGVFDHPASETAVRSTRGWVQPLMVTSSRV